MDAQLPTDLAHLLEPAEQERLQATVARPLAPAIRINTLKTTVQAAADTWPARYGWQTEPVPFCPSGWRVRAGGENLARTAEFKLGMFYIQDAASMLPGELFHLDAGSELLWLDLAAAPGGKTTHLVSRMEDQGLVIANDSSSNRILPLRVNLQDWGATCAVVTQALGERWGAWFPEVFDRVLLDAPCSGQSLRSAERRKSRPVTHRELEALQAQQIRLLVSGFQALRPGGELVYATCSLHPDENEAVLDALLAHYPGAAEIAPISLLRAPTLLSFQGRHYDPAVGNALRLWPHLYDTAGFFAALVHKIDTVPVRREPHPVRPLSEAGYLPLRPREESDLCRQLLETHGFDLEGVLRHHRLALWKRGPKVHALPALYLEQFPDLPVISAGILIGEWKGPAWVPSHELVCRFWSRFAAGRVTLSVEAGQRWLRGEELRDLPAGVAGPGGVVLVQDETGRPLGRGKLSGRRLRNLLPRRLVY